MKKKIFKSILSLLLVFGFITSVHAADSLINISENTKAQAPTVIPNASDTVYATLTEKFDFSRVKFSTTSGGEMNGMTDLRKIILSKTLNENVESLTLANVFGNDWFTAYCLDGELKYPLQGIYTSTVYLNAISAYNNASAADKPEKAQVLVNYMVLSALANDTKLTNLFKSAKGTITEPEVEYEILDGKTASDIYPDGIKNNTFQVNVKSLKYTSFDSNLKIIKFVSTDAEINQEKNVYVAMGYTFDCNTNNGYESCTATQGGSNPINFDFYYFDSNNKTTYYKETIGLKNIMFNQYTTTNELNDDKYNQALWILEHSYPTISIDDTLQLAEVNKATLITELKAVDNRITDANVNDFLENYIYGTIQYAIWRTYNGKENLGDTITNVNELNKLYQFYLQSRTEYTNYHELTSGGEIKITTPEDGKELYKTTDTAYTFGPYKAKFTGVFASDSNANNEIALSIKNTEKTGIKILNSVGTEINSIKQNQEFYIEVLKNSQVGSVTLGTSVQANTYTPAHNRGRIYYPKYSLAQNVMSGGKIGKETITKDLMITVNAKTGVENVAVLLMVTLVAFSLGYLVLSYKGKGSLLK